LRGLKSINVHLGPEDFVPLGWLSNLVMHVARYIVVFANTCIPTRELAMRLSWMDLVTYGGEKVGAPVTQSGEK
jgi:hypothetical protein